VLSPPAAAAVIASNPSIPAMAARKTGQQLEQPIPVGSLNNAEADSMLRFSGKVGRCEASVLIDSGATFNFIAQDFTIKHRMKPKTVDGPTVQLADGTIYKCTSILPKAEVKIGPYRGKAHMYILPLMGNDVILGNQWLTETNPSID
jgi:hypothetical protein